MEIDLLNTYAVCGHERLEALYQPETLHRGQGSETEALSTHHEDSQLHLPT